MKRLILLCVMFVLLTQHANAQQRGDFYVGGMGSVALNSQATTVSSAYDEVSVTQVSTEFGYGICMGYYLTDHIRVSAMFERTASASVSNDVAGTAINLTFYGGSIAYSGEIADGLYYTPELLIGVGRDGSMNDSGIEFPLSGFTASLNLLQLEFRPTEHFGAEINLGSIGIGALGSNVNYSGTSVNLTLAILGISIGDSSSISFKYYF